MSVLRIKNADGTFTEVTGAQGQSAYQIAVKYGKFTGTEEEFASAQVANKEYVDSKIGDIDTILDNINGEVI